MTVDFLASLPLALSSLLRKLTSNSLHNTLSSCAHASILMRPIPAAPEEQDDDEPDPPVPQNLEALAHFIFTRIQKGRCALHAL
jgi:hypothetical protein